MTAVFAAIPKVDLADAVVDRVRDAILGDELEPGSQLPSERDLAVQLGVNRTTVREGLARLEHLGLIDRRQGARCRVCDYRRTGSLELLPALARLGRKDVAPSINEAAGIVYVGTVGLAAARATEADAAELARLAGVVEEAVAGGDVAEISEADRAFQHAVAGVGPIGGARADGQQLLPVDGSRPRRAWPGEALDRADDGRAASIGSDAPAPAAGRGHRGGRRRQGAGHRSTGDDGDGRADHAAGEALSHGRTRRDTCPLA